MILALDRPFRGDLGLGTESYQLIYGPTDETESVIDWINNQTTNEQNLKTEHKQQFMAIAFIGALALAATVPAETISGFYRPLTLAPAEASSSGSVGVDEKAQAAELAKKLQNPVANLIPAPIQNNWDFGIALN